MNRVEADIPIWGTEIYLEASSSTLSETQIRNEISKVHDFYIEVDNQLSTYKSDSAVSLIRKNRLKIEDAPEIVKEVWLGCLEAKKLSAGAFDPWAVEGGFDPSGFVKGWAAEKGADMLVSAGCDEVQINAGGDICLRGGPWKIGIVNPDNKQEILQVFELTNENIATSGHYERGAHIKDPHTGLIAIGAKSGTVIGPDGGLTDAFATAIMVDGTESVQWIGNPELSDYTFWAINRHANTAWSHGPNLGINS